jgi:lipoprotein-anchoring transpeptidase ErfK/SrfK
MKIKISIPLQSLTLEDDQGKALKSYQVSTALNGAGEKKNSYRTPRGKHIVRAKIGAGQPENTVFVGRRPTGEKWSTELSVQHPERDWMLSRILWLSGCEVGFNRLGDCDSMQRYIYIHGTPQSEPVGVPRSHGCIRMRTADVMDLFERVPAGTQVDISD